MTSKRSGRRVQKGRDRPNRPWLPIAALLAVVALAGVLAVTFFVTRQQVPG
ncbi:MAG: hypothetical protein H0X59_06455, partial [Chloroflexi bacterium]|nr:hypothetical protein [Chloroflexota bacterium]